MSSRQTHSRIATLLVGSVVLLVASCTSSTLPLGGFLGGLLGDTGSTGVQDGGAAENEFTVYTNPADSLLFSAVTADGEYLEAYGFRDADGIPLALTNIRFQTSDQLDTDDATWLAFDPAGDLEQIVAEDGTTISFVWMSDTTVVVSAVSGDGSLQVETEVDLSDPEAAYAAPAERQPAAGVAPRGGQRLALTVVDASDKPSAEQAYGDFATGLHKYEQTASGTSEQVWVSVLRCDAPMDGAFVSVTLDNPYQRLPATYTAFPAGSEGLYVATVPVRAASNAGQTAENICNSFEQIAGMGCNLATLTEGKEHQLCLGLSVAIDSALAGPTGEGALIMGACSGGFTALKGYCDTLGASAVDGAPSIAAHYICGNVKEYVDRAEREGWYDLALQAWANADGLAPAHSDIKTVSPAGPFPDLTVEFPDESVIVHPVSLSPIDPAPGQCYTAAVRVDCVPENSAIALSVVGSDGYTDSTAVTVGDGCTLQLEVPGAEAGVCDLITVRVSGVSRLSAAIVF